MLGFMMSLTAHQVAQKGSLLDFAREQRTNSNKRIRRNNNINNSPIRAQKQQQQKQKKIKKMVVQQPTNPGYKPQARISPNYRFIGRTYASLFEPPFACCALWDAAECNCILHPREQSIEYFSARLRSARNCLERSYAVDLFVIRKRAELEIRALDAERREKIGLSSDQIEAVSSGSSPSSSSSALSSEQISINKSSRQPEKKQLKRKPFGGKGLCLIHKLVDHNDQNKSNDNSEKQKKPQPHKWSKTCYSCKTDQVRRRETRACRAAYKAYRQKSEEVLERLHKRMGSHAMFESDTPTLEPRRESSSDDNPARRHGFLRVTDWSENADGLVGNRSGTSRFEARRAAEKQAKVWGRMRGGDGATVLDQTQTRVLNTIEEEEEEE